MVFNPINSHTLTFRSTLSTIDVDVDGGAGVAVVAVFFLFSSECEIFSQVNMFVVVCVLVRFVSLLPSVGHVQFDRVTDTV